MNDHEIKKLIKISSMILFVFIVGITHINGQELSESKKLKAIG